MKTFFKKRNKRFTRLVDFDDAILSRTKSASSKFTTGFTLVETLVAILIFSISILGVAAVLASGISNINSAKQKIIAGYLAQEGIEYLRNMRDNAMLSDNWINSFQSQLSDCNVGNECSVSASGVNHCGNNCELFIDNGDYNTSTGTNSGFTRKVWSEVIVNKKELQVFSKVEWGSNKSVTFSENLFNWLKE